MIENLGDSGRLVLRNAELESAQMGHSHIGVEHLMLGVLALEDRDIQRCFQGEAVDVGVYIRNLKERCAPLSSETGGSEPRTRAFTQRAERVFDEAAYWARSARSESVEAPHILLAILEDEKALPTRVLLEMGTSVRSLVRGVRDLLQIGWDASGYSERRAIEQPGTESPHEKLNALGRDLTEAARRGDLHEAIGREAELLELMTVLTGRKTPNALLIGEAGVGKTAVVEGLAVEIAQGDVPHALKNARIRTIEVGSLVAGTVFRGQFEERLKALITEAENDPDLILFIDEIHMLIGAGAGGLSDAVDAANILKPPLADGRIRVIGATTEDEYRKYLERDAALSRRFAVVRIGEPSSEDTLEILRGLRDRYAEFHGIEILDEALQAAVDLSVRYMPDRRLPDKALVVLDKACSQKKLRAFYGYTDLGEMSREERRQLFRDRSGASEPSGRLVLGFDDIALTVSAMTDIPVGRLKDGEAERLMGLEDRLRRRVVSQDEAVQAVAKVVRKSRAGLGDSARPIGVFLFLGPTGTGKTELAKALTEALFDDERKMVRVDMGECQEPWSLSRLIGSSPGYVDSERGGILTEGIRKNPYTVVLLDEIEKAHPSVHRLLLGMMDEGKLKDGLGREIDCRNTVIIMTSNLGSEAIRGARAFGFTTDDHREPSRREIVSAVDTELKRCFAPEFLNRIDAVVIFNPLSLESLRAVARKMLGKLPIQIEPTPEAIDRLVEAGYDPAMGARPIRRAVERLVVEPLSDAVIRGDVVADRPVRLAVEDGSLVLCQARKRIVVSAQAGGVK